MSLARFWLSFRFVLFFGMHLAVALAIWWTPFHPGWLLLTAGSYLVRIFGVSAGYHRYFSHRAFKTSRPFQLFLAVLAQSANQNGVLWWAAHHRHHHHFSDQPADVHSPVQHGFLRSHLTWFIHRENWAVKEELVEDLLAWPELVWLQRFPFLPSLSLAVLLFVFLGWPGLLYGHLLPTVLLLHATYTINSLAHLWGSQPYDTGDESRNNALLAVITLGEGWHNNHHASPNAASFSRHWLQLDPTYAVLRGLEALGLIWDVRRVRNPR